ncbi:MAG: hypothetical protein ACRDAX_08785 [Propionibacteriaceae bacterium]
MSQPQYSQIPQPQQPQYYVQGPQTLQPQQYAQQYMMAQNPQQAWLKSRPATVLTGAILNFVGAGLLILMMLFMFAIFNNANNATSGMAGTLAEKAGGIIAAILIIGTAWIAALIILSIKALKGSFAAAISLAVMGGISIILHLIGFADMSFSSSSYSNGSRSSDTSSILLNFIWIVWVAASVVLITLLPKSMQWFKKKPHIGA